MTKEQEIKVLESLKKDSYFAGAFTASQINMMQENIKKDFYIFCDVDVYSASDVDGKLLLQKLAHETELDRLQRIIDELSVTVGTQINKIEELEQRLSFVACDVMSGNTAIPFEHNLIGIKKCIQFKLNEGIELSSIEKDYIANNLK